MIHDIEFPESAFSTPAWLYQMSSGGIGGWLSQGDDLWYPSTYKDRVWENEWMRWKIGKIFRNNKYAIREGDTVVFFFCKAGEIDPYTGKKPVPGIYGWGTVEVSPKDIESVKENYCLMDVRIHPPSDYLKEDVLWNNSVKSLVNEIRCNFYQATMWAIESEQLNNLCVKIKDHIVNPRLF